MVIFSNFFWYNDIVQDYVKKKGINDLKTIKVRSINKVPRVREYIIVVQRFW